MNVVGCSFGAGDHLNEAGSVGGGDLGGGGLSGEPLEELGDALGHFALTAQGEELSGIVVVGEEHGGVKELAEGGLEQGLYFVKGGRGVLGHEAVVNSKLNAGEVKARPQVGVLFKERAGTQGCAEGVPDAGSRVFGGGATFTHVEQALFTKGLVDAVDLFVSHEQDAGPWCMWE